MRIQRKGKGSRKGETRKGTYVKEIHIKSGGRKREKYNRISKGGA